jgi:hypothetical protein
MGFGGEAMQDVELHVIESSEDDRIKSWRTEELERAGYSPRAAGRLAERRDIDLHKAVRLLESGCTPQLALRILL